MNSSLYMFAYIERERELINKTMKIDVSIISYNIMYFYTTKKQKPKDNTLTIHLTLSIFVSRQSGKLELSI